MLMTVVTTSDPEAHVTVTGHVCVGGLSDSARGGWINAEQIINSESGADIMHPAPSPPHGAGTIIGSWTESRSTNTQKEN